MSSGLRRENCFAGSQPLFPVRDVRLLASGSFRTERQWLAFLKCNASLITTTAVFHLIVPGYRWSSNWFVQISFCSLTLQWCLGTYKTRRSPTEANLTMKHIANIIAPRKTEVRLRWNRSHKTPQSLYSPKTAENTEAARHQHMSIRCKWWLPPSVDCNSISGSCEDE